MSFSTFPQFKASESPPDYSSYMENAEPVPNVVRMCKLPKIPTFKLPKMPTFKCPDLPKFSPLLNMALVACVLISMYPITYIYWYRPSMGTYVDTTHNVRVTSVYNNGTLLNDYFFDIQTPMTQEQRTLEYLKNGVCISAPNFKGVCNGKSFHLYISRVTYNGMYFDIDEQDYKYDLDPGFVLRYGGFVRYESTNAFGYIMFTVFHSVLLAGILIAMCVESVY